MTKREFMSQLQKALSGLPKAEVSDILMEYEVHFSEGVKAGKTEEGIASELGSPQELAKMYKVGALIQTAEENVSTNNIVRAVLASVGLGLFNLILVLGPFLGVLGLIVGIFGASLGLVLVGLILFAYTVFGPFGSTWLSIPGAWTVEPLISAPLGIGMFALGVLIFIFGVVLGQGLYRLTIRYLRFNLKMIKGK